MNVKLVGGLLLIAVVLGGLFGVYRYGRHVEFIIQDNNRKEAIINAAKENDALKLKLQEERQNAETALNTLLATPAPRVQVPTCRGQANPAGGSAVSATSPERTSDLAQAAFERFAGRLELDAAAWSRAIEACRVTMEWAKAQGQ